MRKLKDGAIYKVWSGLDHLKPKMEDFEARLHFLQIVEEVRLVHPFELLTFSILQDRIYMVIRPLHKLDENGQFTDEWEQLPVIMQRIKWTYAKWFNTENGISGHVWKYRYSSKVLLSPRLIEAAILEVDSYAVAQKMAETPEEYVFSGSYFHIHEIFEVDDCKTRCSYLKRSEYHKKRKGEGVEEDVGTLSRLKHLKLLAKMRPKVDSQTTTTVY